MNPIISIMSQGAMGAATASRLVENGLEVRTNLSGRGAASAERAAKAGMKPVSDDELSSADFLLSIVPPAEALSLAERLSPALARTARKTVFVDLNAINPETTKKVAQIVKATGALFVDGGIIGGPPRAGYDGPAYYVSGVDAKLVEALAPFGLKDRCSRRANWRRLRPKDVLRGNHQRIDCSQLLNDPRGATRGSLRRVVRGTFNQPGRFARRLHTGRP